jgi:hypothetical protein
VRTLRRRNTERRADVLSERNINGARQRVSAVRLGKKISAIVPEATVITAVRYAFRVGRVLERTA